MRLQTQVCQGKKKNLHFQLKNLHFLLKNLSFYVVKTTRIANAGVGKLHRAWHQRGLVSFHIEMKPFFAEAEGSSIEKR